MGVLEPETIPLTNRSVLSREYLSEKTAKSVGDDKTYLRAGCLAWRVQGRRIPDQGIRGGEGVLRGGGGTQSSSVLTFGVKIGCFPEAREIGLLIAWAFRPNKTRNRLHEEVPLMYRSRELG